MTSLFPGSLDTIATDKSDGTSMVGDHAAHHNDLADAVNKIELKLGSGAGNPTSGKFLKGTGSGTSGWSVLTSGEVTAALAYTPVSLSGDTMIGGLTIRPAGANLIDSTTWNPRFSGLNVNQRIVGTATASSANEFAFVGQNNIDTVTSSAASYQKTGLLWQAQTIDPSDYSGAGIFRDAVAVDFRAIIGGSITTGRAWAANFIGKVLSGADGYMPTVEIALFNLAADYTVVDSQKGKFGLLLNNLSTGHGTAALWIHAASTGIWHKGIYTTAADLGVGSGDSFLEIGSNYRVMPSGKTVIGGTTEAFSVAKLEIVGPASTAQPLVFIGNSANTNIYTVRLRNAVGAHEWFIASANGDILTGTVAGDSGIKIITAAKSFHIGGTSSVLQVTAGNALGFFQITPIVQYGTTGTSTGFTAGGGTTVTHLSTFTGNTGSAAYTIGDLIRAAKLYGLIAA